MAAAATAPAWQSGFSITLSSLSRSRKVRRRSHHSFSPLAAVAASAVAASDVAASAVVASATVAFLITCSTEVTAIVAWERPAGKHRLLDQRH